MQDLSFWNTEKWGPSARDVQTLRQDKMNVFYNVNPLWQKLVCIFFSPRPAFSSIANTYVGKKPYSVANIFYIVNES